MSLTVNLSMSFQKGGISDAFAAQQTAAMSIAGYKVQSPTIGTSVMTISTASIETLGYAYLRSLVTTTQATCTLTVGRLDGTSFSPVISMRPGEPAVFRMSPGTYAAQAAAEGYRLLVAIVEG